MYTVEISNLCRTRTIEPVNKMKPVLQKNGKNRPKCVNFGQNVSIDIFWYVNFCQLFVFDKIIDKNLHILDKN